MIDRASPVGLMNDGVSLGDDDVDKLFVGAMKVVVEEGSKEDVPVGSKTIDNAGMLELRLALDFALLRLLAVLVTHLRSLSSPVTAHIEDATDHIVPVQNVFRL